MTLTLSAAMQTIVSVINRIQGLVIIALLFELYSLSEMGEYLLILSYFSVFISIQNMGISKVLVQSAKNQDVRIAGSVFSLKIFVSIVCAFVFGLLLYIYSKDVWLVVIFSSLLMASAFTTDWILIGMRRIKVLSYIQFSSQFILLVILFSSYLFEISMPIFVHQMVPTLFMFFGVALFTNNSFFNLGSLLVPSVETFAIMRRHIILIFFSLLLSVVGVVEMSLGKLLLSEEELGLLGGVLRLATFSYGLLLTINGVVFAYNDVEGFENSKGIFKWVSALSLLVLLISFYPYMRYIVGVNYVEFDLALAGICMAVGVLFMAKFFYMLSRVEKDFEKLDSLFVIRRWIQFMLIFLFVVALIILASKFLEIALSVLLFIFTIKWIVLYRYINEVLDGS